jgi:hypothetical protein
MRDARPGRQADLPAGPDGPRAQACTKAGELHFYARRRTSGNPPVVRTHWRSLGTAAQMPASGTAEESAARQGQARSNVDDGGVLVWPSFELDHPVRYVRAGLLQRCRGPALLRAQPPARDAPLPRDPALGVVLGLEGDDVLDERGTHVVVSPRRRGEGRASPLAEAVVPAMWEQGAAARRTPGWARTGGLPRTGMEAEDRLTAAVRECNVEPVPTSWPRRSDGGRRLPRHRSDWSE